MPMKVCYQDKSTWVRFITTGLAGPARLKPCEIDGGQARRLCEEGLVQSAGGGEVGGGLEGGRRAGVADTTAVAVQRPRLRISLST